MIKKNGKIKRYFRLSFFLKRMYKSKYRSRGGRKEISINATYARNEDRVVQMAHYKFQHLINHENDQKDNYNFIKLILFGKDKNINNQNKLDASY